MTARPAGWRAPARSLLFVRGDQPERVGKALAGEADAVVIDLEDGVHPDAKDAARAALRAHLLGPRRPGLRAFVRVNGLDSGLTAWDLQAALAGALDGVMIPKVERREHLEVVDSLLERLERDAGLARGGVAVLALVETARALVDLGALEPVPARVERLCFGGADYAADLGIAWRPGSLALLDAKLRLPPWSRALGLAPPVDGPYPDIRDADGLAAECEAVNALGFAGKLCLHPDQVPVVNAAFSPGRDEVERARRIVAAFAAARARGEVSVTVDGSFVDGPVAERARRLLERAGLDVEAVERDR